MDDPLYTIRNLFFYGAWEKVVEEPIDEGESSAQTARVYQYRARIELGDAKGVLADLKGAKQPWEKAVLAYAKYMNGQKKPAVEQLEKLVNEAAGDADVQVLAATVLCREGREDEALQMLAEPQTVDTMALAVQIHLLQNRPDLAERAWKKGKEMGEAVPTDLAEAWVHVRNGGTEYDAAFYILEEMAQTPASQTSKTLTSQAISEIHLGRIPEAEVTLQQVLEADPQNIHALANMVVTAILAGKPRAEIEQAYGALEAASGEHEMVQSTKEKIRQFDESASKYKLGQT